MKQYTIEEMVNGYSIIEKDLDSQSRWPTTYKVSAVQVIARLMQLLEIKGAISAQMAPEQVEIA